MGAYYGNVIDRLNDLCQGLRPIGRSPGDWRETASDIDLLDGLDDEAIELISMWPDGLRDAVVALVASAAASGARLRFLWKPGYDFEVSMSKVNADRDGQAEYSVLLTSPYPHEIKRGRG